MPQPNSIDNPNIVQQIYVISSLFSSKDCFSVFLSNFSLKVNTIYRDGIIFGVYFAGKKI